MIILTGGAGFIGSCLLRALNNQGHTSILVVDHLTTTEKWKNLLNKSFEDYLDRDDFLQRIQSGQIDPKSVRAIIHLGACSSTFELNSAFLMENNYRYSRTLAEWALKNNIRFLYASSAATYGNGECGYSDDTSSLYKLRPLNMYGYSKHLFDEWVQRIGAFDTFSGFKFFNVFGPNEYHKGEMRSVVHKAFFQIQKEGCLRLFKSHRSDFKDGEQLRDFIYVGDAVEILMHVFNNENIAGLFNIGSGRAISWNALGNSIFEAMGVKPKIEYIDMPIEIRDRYQYYTKAEMAKIRETGLTKAFRTVEQSIHLYINEYLKSDRFI